MNVERVEGTKKVAADGRWSLVDGYEKRKTKNQRRETRDQDRECLGSTPQQLEIDRFRLRRRGDAELFGEEAAAMLVGAEGFGAVSG